MPSHAQRAYVNQLLVILIVLGLAGMVAIIVL